MSISATTTIQPYLFFGGRCDEALAFYKTALGATVDMLMRYKESPDPAPPGMLAPGWEEKVMHATFRIGGAIVMGSDGCSPEDGKSSGFKLALNVPTEAEAARAFAGLADGGTVELPLTKTFWSPQFGMLTDRFGIAWMVSVPAAQKPPSRP
jgi:PhnB protein